VHLVLRKCRPGMRLSTVLQRGFVAVMIESIAAANTDTTEVAAVPAVSPDVAAPETEELGAHDSAPLLLITSAPQVASDLLAEAQEVGFDCDVCMFPQALSLLKSGAYIAAVVDVGTPQEAFSLIEQARGISTSRQVPIVALANPGDVNSAFRVGASFAVPRPVTPDLLRNTLAAIFRISVGLRRQYARYRVEMSLSLTVADRSINAKATDIGNSGMALVAAEPLLCGTVVSVCFVLPGCADQIVVVGEIRWTDPYGRAGLCFNSIAGTGRTSLENWLARRHAGIDHPEPSHAPATVAQLPPQATTADKAADPAAKTTRIFLSGALVAFCLFVIGFWIYIALTS
jgi:CheY-like chemotaxis protein